jgi:hypothetical protein
MLNCFEKYWQNKETIELSLESAFRTFSMDDDEEALNLDELYEYLFKKGEILSKEELKEFSTALDKIKKKKNEKHDILKSLVQNSTSSISPKKSVLSNKPKLGEQKVQQSQIVKLPKEFESHDQEKLYINDLMQYFESNIKPTDEKNCQKKKSLSKSKRKVSKTKSSVKRDRSKSKNKK